jgi:hypothetical protein
MRPPMLITQGRYGIVRRAIAVIAGLLLAAVAVIAAGGSAAAAPKTTAALPSASDQAVLSALHIGSVPTEMIFLVDHSESMKTGAYGAVKTALNKYFANFPAQDQAVVITFSDPQTAAAKLVYGPGPAPADIGPDLAQAGEPAGGTDFGDAFSAALDQLDNPPSGIKAGGVVLLSDGILNAPKDSRYSSYTAPDWTGLKTRADSLTQNGFPVAAYAIPLVTGDRYVTAQQTALKKVFDPVETLTGAQDLPAKLAQATADVKDGQVNEKITNDKGKGVQAAWTGLPGSGSPLDLASARSVPIGLRLRAQTSKVPLYLTGLQVSSPRIPLTVTGLPSEVTLQPGQTVRIPLTVSWKATTGPISLGSGQQTVSSSLRLAATVGSPWSAALLDFHIKQFSFGTVTGGTSAPLTAAEPLYDVLLQFLLILLILIVLVIVAAYIARLRGTLLLAPVDGPRPDEFEEHHLPPFPVARIGTRQLLGQDSRMTVLSWGRKMKVRIVHQNGRGAKLRGTVDLRPDGRAMAGGLDIVHRRDR